MWQDREIRFDSPVSYVLRGAASTAAAGASSVPQCSLFALADLIRRNRALDLRRGEMKIDSINSVEDTKGNNGERGTLSITNLRLMWVAHRHSRTNLSAYGAV